MLLPQIRALVSSLNPSMSPQELDRVRQEALGLLGPNGGAEQLHNRLSPREKQVMNMMLAGTRLKEIAKQLDISVKTVTTHRARLLRKLGLPDNLALYRYAVRQGLVDL
jgi:DNA-binding NarL/FixJ family response regulator